MRSGAGGDRVQGSREGRGWHSVCQRRGIKNGAGEGLRLRVREGDGSWVEQESVLAFYRLLRQLLATAHDFSPLALQPPHHLSHQQHTAQPVFT